MKAFRVLALWACFAVLFIGWGSDRALADAVVVTGLDISTGFAANGGFSVDLSANDGPVFSVATRSLDGCDLFVCNSTIYFSGSSGFEAVQNPFNGDVPLNVAPGTVISGYNGLGWTYSDDLYLDYSRLYFDGCCTEGLNLSDYNVGDVYIPISFNNGTENGWLNFAIDYTYGGVGDGGCTQINQFGGCDGYVWDVTLLGYGYDTSGNAIIAGGGDVPMGNVPTPGTLALLATGLAGVAARRRRKIA